MYLMLLCGICVFCNASIAWASPTKIPFAIPAGEFDNSILDWGEQAKVLVSYGLVTGSFKGIRTRAVVGAFDAHEALAILLQDTGLVAEWHSESWVVLRRIDPGASTMAGGAQPVVQFDVPPAAMDQVLVTGTLIRGVAAITAPLITLTRGQIPDTGYAGVQSMVDNELPIASNNTPREDYEPIAGNFGFGLGINLRGLGVGATLVLVDGRRQPLAGSNGAFVDVSAIPSTAVDHIEVVADGASALYGSDAIAGVVNIILRHDFVGAETLARYSLGEGGGDEALVSQVFGATWDGGHGMLLYQYTDRTSIPIVDRSYASNADKRPEGGDDFRSIDANPGNILSPVTYLPAFAIPPGQDGRALSVSQLLPGKVNLQNQWLGYDLYPQRTTHSFYFTVEQQVSSAVKWFFDGRLDRRAETYEDQPLTETLTVPSSNPYFVDPFGHSPYVLVAYSFLNDLGNAHRTIDTVTATAVLGLRVEIGGGWQSTVSLSDGVQSMDGSIYNWDNPTALSAALADSNLAMAFNPFGAGSNTPRSTLNKIRAVQGEDAWSRVPDFGALADGPLFSRNGTSLKLAVGLDLRQESLRQHQSLTNYEDFRAAYQRELASAFTELALGLPGHVEVSLAGRYEHYSDFGSTTNPKVGVRWSPSSSVRLRASWGTSFRAPELPDLNTSRNYAGLIYLADPRSPTGQSVVLYEAGNSPRLHQETAATWALGLDLAPVSIPGLQTSLTYYSIDYRDRIVRPGPANYLDILQDEATWGEVIQRNPPASVVMAICNGPRFLSAPSTCQSTPPAAIADYRVRNLSRTVAKGVDLNLEQRFDNVLGFFRWSVRGAYVLTFDQAVTDSAPTTSVANTVSYPIKLKARTTLGWSERRVTLPGWSFTLAASFAGAYLDSESVPNRRVGSYSTVDAQLGYSTGEGHRWFENTEIILSATNLFDTNPPFVNNQLGFDQPNTPPTARLVTISLKRKW